MKLWTRAFSALRKIVAVGRGALDTVCLRPRERGTALIASNGRILVEILHVGEQSGSEDILIPVDMAERIGQLGGQKIHLVAPPDGTLQAHGRNGLAEGHLMLFDHGYPKVEPALAPDKRAGHLSFDLHILGQALDALRKIHPQPKEERVYLHLAILGTAQAMGAVVDDPTNRDIETRAVVMPLDLSTTQGRHRRPAWYRPFDLRRQKRSEGAVNDGQEVSQSSL